MNKIDKLQKIIIVAIIIAAISIIGLTSYLVSTLKFKENEQYKQDLSSDLESTSTQMGKTVEESENDYENPSVVEKDEDEEGNTIKDTNTKNKNDYQNTTVETASVEEKKESNQNEESEDVVFQCPIKGQILREYAKESLVYSDTLQEWITHNGVDIKADKTSVVSAAASGTVQAIKNDPRYGLTVIINHNNGYQTIYSNLLTAEFVVEGEKVEIGQSIGTVGNTAAFEISDDYHLHFELLQDNKYLDPTIYMSFE